MKYIYLTFIALVLVSCSSISLQQKSNYEANIDIDAKRYGDAKKKYLLALEEARRVGDKEYTAIALYGLGRANGYLCNFEEAEQWFKKSIETRESLADNQHAYITQNKLELARLYKASRKYALSNEQFQQAIERLENLGIRSKDPIGYALVLEDYKFTLIQVGNLTKYTEVTALIEELKSLNPGIEPKFVAKQYSESCG
jgi:tetratricopeptide (TPR) repeat protein